MKRAGWAVLAALVVGVGALVAFEGNEAQAFTAAMLAAVAVFILA